MIIVFSGIANAQISGQLFQYESEFPGVQVYFKSSEQKVESDFDGFFKSLIPKGNEKNDLILSGYGMTIEIQNFISDSTMLDLGKIEIPTFKSIEINEYEQLTEPKKENCYPIYHWTQLIGYTYTLELENDYITLNCEQKITDFEYNSETKTIKINWNIIKNCE